MFLIVYIWGLVLRNMWRLGFMASGTAPSFSTSYNCYGWLGYHYKHRHNPLHICWCNKIFRHGKNSQKKHLI